MMAEGKLKFKIDYVNGFEECPNALIKLLKG
jgi:NADPH-dependent curcumin reductase CurA